MSGRGNPRRSNGWRRTKLRKRLAAQGLPCHICGQAIDYSLPAGDPMSFEVDEVKPVSRWREFGYSSPEQAALDPSNVAPAHRICNERRGNRTVATGAGCAPKPPTTSTDW